MIQHDLPSVDYEKLKHQDWSCSIVVQVFVDADRASVQMKFEDMPVEFWNGAMSGFRINMLVIRIIAVSGFWSNLAFEVNTYRASNYVRVRTSAEQSLSWWDLLECEAE